MNIRPYIIINNVNSQSIQGLLISELPPISKPQQRTRIEEIDGRDGDLVTPLGYAAYDKTIKIGLTYGYDIDEIIEYFNSEGVVIFSNEPDKYYRFAIYEQIDFEKLIRFKSAEVVFHCQPFKFSTTEEPLLFDVSSGNPITVTNSGNTISRPNLLILGNDEIDVSLNGSQILTIDLSDEDQAVIINAEDMNAYAAESAIKEVIAEINPVQDGSGDPSPSNVRAISGFTKANVTRLGKNLINITEPLSTISGVTTTLNPDGSITLNGTSTGSGTIRLNRNVDLPYATYTFTAQAKTGVSISVQTSAGNKSASSTGITFTASIKGLFWIYFNAAGIVFDDFTIYPQIERGSESTDYEAYLGEVYEVDFGDAGTVYSGSLNVTTGLLTINQTKKTFSELDIQISDTGYFYCYVDGYNYPQGGSIISNVTKFGGNQRTWLNDKTYAISPWASTSTNRIAIKGDGTETTVAQLLTNLGADNYIVYDLATPQEVQLTPTQVNNLLGLNNLFTNTNGDITVTFSSDGVIQTETGDIVTFTAGAEDMTRGVLLNRLITGNYDKIRLKKGENTLSLTGGAQQLVIDNYSRWL